LPIRTDSLSYRDDQIWANGRRPTQHGSPQMARGQETRWVRGHELLGNVAVERSTTVAVSRMAE